MRSGTWKARGTTPRINIDKVYTVTAGERASRAAQLQLYAEWLALGIRGICSVKFICTSA